MALTNTLATIRNNVSIGMFTSCVLQRMKPEDIVAANIAIIGEDGFHCVPRGKQPPPSAGQYYVVDFGGAGTGTLPHPWNVNRATIEFSKMLLRNFTLDSFEAVRAYCMKEHRNDDLWKQPWYQFARMMRNSLTHTQRFDFRPPELKRLPVTWRDKAITAEMNGQEPGFEFFDWWDGCELWQEMYVFAKAIEKPPTTSSDCV
jgi:hypothetical protein